MSVICAKGRGRDHQLTPTWPGSADVSVAETAGFLERFDREGGKPVHASSIRIRTYFSPTFDPTRKFGCWWLSVDAGRQRVNRSLCKASTLFDSRMWSDG
jgi:hypothetical protein